MASNSRTSPRRPRPVVDLEVVSTERLSPHLVRVRLGGAGFATFEDRPETDKYAKLRFTTPAPESPVTRTYTVRRVDHEAQTLDIEFVVHGDEAGPWAATAARCTAQPVRSGRRIRPRRRRGLVPVRGRPLGRAG